MCLSANFSNGHFKRNLLGKMLVLGTRCINIYPENCILSQIPIACQEMGSTQLKCVPTSSSTMFLGELKSKLQPKHAYFGKSQSLKKITNCPYLFQRAPMSLNESVFLIYFRINCQSLSSRSNTKTINVLVKKGLWFNFYLVK